jgi:multidrug resistance efflux pump
MKLRFRTEWLYYGAAAAALAFSATAVTRSQPQTDRRAPVGDIAYAPYESAIAATGVVEPSSRTLVISADTEGVINTIFVKPGQNVAAGDPLFSLDDTRHRAAVEQAKAQTARALAEIDMRRADARGASAAAEAARSRAAHLRTTVVRYRPIAAEAMSAEDFDKLVSDAEAATFSYREAQHAAAAADATAIAAQEDAALAQASLAAAQAELERTVMRAPIAGAVLSIDARLGEAVRPADREPPSISVGAIETLYARVEIDESQVHRFDPGAKATAYLRGQSGDAILLAFESIEPLLKPKSAFRDTSAEYIDSRVLEARYRIEHRGSGQLYVGQLLDVFINVSGASARDKQQRPQFRSDRAAPAPRRVAFDDAVQLSDNLRP